MVVKPNKEQPYNYSPSQTGWDGYDYQKTTYIVFCEFIQHGEDYYPDGAIFAEYEDEEVAKDMVFLLNKIRVERLQSEGAKQ